MFRGIVFKVLVWEHPANGSVVELFVKLIFDVQMYWNVNKSLNCCVEYHLRCPEKITGMRIDSEIRDRKASISYRFCHSGEKYLSWCFFGVQ